MKKLRIATILVTLALLLLTACQPESSPVAALPDEPAEGVLPAEQESDAAAATPEVEGADATTAENTLPTEVVSYVIVPEESSASYMVDEEFFQDALSKYGINAGRQDTVGTTSAIEGQFTLNWANLAEQPLGENSFSVDLSTLESDQGLRDRWLRNNGPEFNTYPSATFVASELRGGPDVYSMGETVEFQLVGQLTIRETTQPATFLVQAALNGDTVTGTATTTAYMSNFGIEPPDFANTLTVQDEFQIKVDFTARAQQ